MERVEGEKEKRRERKKGREGRGEKGRRERGKRRERKKGRGENGRTDTKLTVVIVLIIRFSSISDLLLFPSSEEFVRLDLEQNDTENRFRKRTKTIQNWENN